MQSASILGDCLPDALLGLRSPHLDTGPRPASPKRPGQTPPMVSSDIENV